MNSVGRLVPQIGDWVSGTSLMDERFIGFVESIDLNGLVKVRVTQCDHRIAVGHSLRAWYDHIQPLPANERSETESLRSMVDLALMARDRSWFEELSAELARLESDESKSFSV